MELYLHNTQATHVVNKCTTFHNDRNEGTVGDLLGNVTAIKCGFPLSHFVEHYLSLGGLM
jgi:hypothetical protein